MDIKLKGLYVAPSTGVFEVKIEGVICQSGAAGVADYTWNDLEEE